MRGAGAAQHRVIQEKARTKLMGALLKDHDRLYTLLWELLDSAQREDDARVRLLQTVLGKIAPDQREVLEPESGPKVPPIAIYIDGGVNRGTGAARDAALQHRNVLLVTDDAPRDPD